MSIEDKILSIVKPCIISGQHAHCVSGNLLRSIINPRKTEAHMAIRQAAARLGAKAILFIYRRVVRRGGSLALSQLMKVVMVSDGADPSRIRDYYVASGRLVRLETLGPA